MNFISINYHYIDEEDKYEGGIYPVSVERLSDQLNKIGKDFEFIGEADLIAAIEGRIGLPRKSCLITFDDGLRSQYDHAVPILESKGIPAVFYINTLPLSRGKACTVHKVHFLLSKMSTDVLLKKVIQYYNELAGRRLELEKVFSGIEKNKGIYDDDKTFKLKYLINSYLDHVLSGKIVQNIFGDYCGNERGFCEQLYMSKEQLLGIKENKLFSLGLHTASHINISIRNKDDVFADIVDNACYFKRELSVKKINGISYPYGLISENDINEKAKPQVSALGIKYGLTMHVGVNRDLKTPFLLKRFDTNDIEGGENLNFKY